MNTTKPYVRHWGNNVDKLTPAMVESIGLCIAILIGAAFFIGLMFAAMSPPKNDRPRSGGMVE